MQAFDEIKAYSKAVCAQIRWQKAHDLVTSEIERHITDQRGAYLAQGDDPAAATRKAIRQMGDATEVGLHFDQIHRPKPQWALIGLTALLISVGAIANSLLCAQQYTLANFNPLPFGIAFGVFLLCYFTDFTTLGRYAAPIYLSACVFSAAGLLFGISFNGRRFWVIGGFSFGLSYLAIVFPLVFALLVYRLRCKGYRGILLCGVSYLPLALILVLVPTGMGLLLFTLSTLVILCFAIARGWFGVSKQKGLLLVLLPTLLTTATIGLNLWGHRVFRRVAIVLNPYPHRNGEGFIYALIRDLLVGARLIGKGTVPEIFDGQLPPMENYRTDYMLSILTHQLGWIALIGIAAGIGIFSLLAFRRIYRQKSVLGSLVSLSILLSFVLQTVFYFLSNLGYGLFGALSLPLISYGNSSLLLNAALIGFMLSVFRSGDVFRDKLQASPQEHRFFSYQDGRLTIDFGRRSL